MESLGTGRKEARRGRKRQDGAQRGKKGQEEAGRGQEEAGRGRKRLSPFLPPSPAIPSLVPLKKKVKRALASLPPLGSFYFFTFLLLSV